jgi:hypothetical protein
VGDVVAETALETVADGRDRAPPLLGLAEDGMIASQGAV